jgi:hypothetical protein
MTLVALDRIRPFYRVTLAERFFVSIADLLQVGGKRLPCMHNGNEESPESAYCCCTRSHASGICSVIIRNGNGFVGFPARDQVPSILSRLERFVFFKGTTEPCGVPERSIDLYQSYSYLLALWLRMILGSQYILDVALPAYNHYRKVGHHSARKLIEGEGGRGGEEEEARKRPILRFAAIY